MDAKTTSILSYITIVGWLIAFFAGEREDSLSKHHLNQGLVLAIAELIFGVVIGLICLIISLVPLVGGFISAIVGGVGGGLVGLGFLIFAILGIVAAVNGEEKSLPVIGAIKLIK